MWNGKKKALTFSYDDGVEQDKRLITLFDKYGLKATFNLNSERFGICGKNKSLGVAVDHCAIVKEEVRSVYEGHEVAAHTLTHPLLPSLDDGEVIRQVERDRLHLSEIVGYEVVGLAYPCGGVNFDDRVVDLITKNTGVKYCRTTVATGGFMPQSDLFRFHPSVHHINLQDVFRLGEEFLALETDEPRLFYVWGHSYEFDALETWGRFEEFCRMMSGKNDIFYGTNKEVLL